MIATFGFLTWLTPFLPLAVLASLGVVMVDIERPRLFSRTLTVKLAQLALLVMSLVFMMASMAHEFHSNLLLFFVKLLIAVGGSFMAFLYFLVSPVSPSTVVAVDEEREVERRQGQHLLDIDDHLPTDFRLWWYFGDH